MQAYELHITVPPEHTLPLTLPPELPTGSKARVIILVDTADETAPTPGSPEAVLAYLRGLEERRKDQPPGRTAEEIESYILECRNDWDDRP